MKKFLALLALVGMTASAATLPTRFQGDVYNYGNVVVGGSTAPDSKAVLDVRSTTKGFLFPRMTTTQRNAISSPTTGLTIFNTSTATIDTYNGSSWASSGTQTLNSAHWYIGNGSSVATDVAMSGDTSVTNTGAVTVNTVGGSSAANIHAAELLANGATTASTPNKIVLRDGSGNILGVASTSSDVEYLTNGGFETGTSATGWTVSGPTGSNETSTIYEGANSEKLVYSSNTGGITQDVTPTTNTASQNLEASCWVNTSLTTAEVCARVAGVKSGCTTVPSTGTFQNVVANFVGPANGTSVGIIADVTGSSTGTMYVDKCHLGPARNLGQSQVNTAWAAYTPTFTGFGTVTVQSFWWRRIGDSLQIKGRFTPGTPTATEARISFPNSYVADSAKMHGTSELCGSMARVPAGGSFNTLSTICEPSVSYFTMGIYSAGTAYSGGASGPMVKMLGNDLVASGNDESIFLQIPVTAFTDQSIYRPDATPASWAGYQTVSGGCSTTSTTYADTSACTSIAVTQQQNRNFGTVTTAGSSLPGVTFTPPRSGNYLVCASGTVSSTLAATASVRMTDGTNVLHNGVSITNSAVGDGVFSLCGTENISAIASTTIKLQLATSTSTSSIVNGTASGSSAIQWSIVELDAPMSAPYLTGSITTNAPTGYRIESARITNSGSCAVGSQTGTWITGTPGHPGTGQCTLNITGAFSVAPVCVCTQTDSSSYVCNLSAAATTTSIATETLTGGGSDTDRPFNIMCMGQR